MELVAALAEHAAPSCRRVGARPIRRSRGAARAAAGRARIASRRRQARRREATLPFSRRWSAFRSRPSACPAFRRRRPAAARRRRWSNGRSPAPATSRSFSSLRICSGSTRRRSISCRRSAIAARRRRSSFWRRRGPNSGRPGPSSRTISVISLAPLDEAQVQRMIAELAISPRAVGGGDEARRRSRGRRAAVRRGGDAAHSRARRAGGGAGNSADAQAVAGGAARPAGTGARSRADRRGPRAELLLSASARRRVSRRAGAAGTRRSLARIRAWLLSSMPTFSSSMASRRRRPTASSMR